MACSVEVRVGRRIATFRHAAGLTQQELAERSELAVETIGRIERGRQMPSLARLETIAHALGVTLADLVRERRKVGPRERAVTALRAMLRERPAEDAEMLLDVARVLFRPR
jgi:transcriptional regulator with XRE-family HTH domain